MANEALNERIDSDPEFGGRILLRLRAHGEPELLLVTALLAQIDETQDHFLEFRRPRSDRSNSLHA